MGIRRIVQRLLPSVLTAGVAISMLLPFPAGAQADKTAPGGKPSIEILAPVEGATVPRGKVIVIGRVRGAMAPSVEVDVNGKVHHKAVTAGGGFMATAYVTGGKNLLTVHADGITVAIHVFASDTVTYKYHPGVEKCAGCHTDVSRGYVVSGRKDTVCYQCHDRKDGKRLIHGPLGGGDCTTCHDPHGAMNPALTVAKAEGLCARCHDQPHSQKHVRESKAVGCVTCHEPHSSGKEFLQK